MRVLFVDDEPKMLRGLRRMLSQKRKEWGMSFVDSGRAALDLLEKEKYDILVTDMRMPGISGEKLLVKVKDAHPEMIRIILSGHSDQEEIMKTVRLAHQYLAKPCDPDVLINTISKAARFRSYLDDPRLNKLVSSIEMLPSPGSRYLEIMENLDSDDVSLRKIGQLISRDMGLSANILKLVNSSFFSIPRRVANVVDAVVFLGLDIIKGLILTHHLFSVFDFSKLPNLSYEMLWNHSTYAACLGQAIIKTETDDKTVVDETFIAGLMHDVGKLVLGYVIKEEYEKVIKEARARNRRLWKVEADFLGFSHAEVGAYLVGIWGMSENLVETIQYHHSPEKCIQEGLVMLAAIHVANVLDHRLRIVNRGCSLAEYNEEYLKKNGFMGRIGTWQKVCQEFLDKDKGEENGCEG